MKWLRIIIASLIIAFVVAYLTGCDTAEPIERIDISGRYQSIEQSMILLLEHNYRNISATLEWQGISTNLSGKYDELNSQVIMSGLYFGSYQISFNLIHGANNMLAGGFVFANNGTEAIQFEFKNKLSKHDQGGL